MKRIAIVDYGSGNVRSVRKALERAGQSVRGTVSTIVTDDPDDLMSVDGIVLPGVGHFADCAAALRSRSGLIEAIHEAVFSHGRPFMGICVGMQLLATFGEEDQITPGLDWISGSVGRLRPSSSRLPIPHMGWNTLLEVSNHPVLAGLGDEPHVYFTHSYAITPKETQDIAAQTDYGGSIAAAVARGPLFGTQFHPEKSQTVGQKILLNFLNWRPG
ncbi:MAG: imidazole glycerol phosphate synthase subunit HisH [Alphaproteobacteria bacterium]|nr:imidazole glycerol phosphate synthase subunit HisH [Alphaproteobacteria bacterium]